jgi:hypothetical protein
MVFEGIYIVPELGWSGSGNLIAWGHYLGGAITIIGPDGSNPLVLDRGIALIGLSLEIA